MSDSQRPANPTPPADAAVLSPAVAQVGRGIAAAAVLIALGSIASRVLGQVRESFISFLFGVSDTTSAFAIASAVPTYLYDLIVGGMVSAALIPVFSELAERDERELGRVAGTIFTFATLLMLAAAALTWLTAPQIGSLLTWSAGPSPIRATTISLIRWMLPATILMALAGLVTGLLQARRQFLLPAFSAATFNLGIIIGGLLFSQRFGVASLAIGMGIGALGQVLLQSPGLRGLALRPSLHLGHPDVRRIGVLYLPVLIGLGFSLVGTTIDRALASGVSEGAAAQMRFATTLIQLALGIVATAISLAALPTLSRQGVDGADLSEYRRTLALSIKALLLLLLPVTAMLAGLAFPVASFLFQWGAADQAAAGVIALALLVYLPMLVAAGVDQPLIFAFYARRNTLLPNLVNGAAIGAYLVTALALVQWLGVYGLILGNVVQWWTHALLMLWFAHHRLDALRGQRLGEAIWKGLVASALAGLLCFGIYSLLGDVATKVGTLAQITGIGLIGIAVYVTVAWLLRLETLGIFGQALAHRLGR
jgi:putative peptidoglycan lipid II flippase